MPVPPTRICLDIRLYHNGFRVVPSHEQLNRTLIEIRSSGLIEKSDSALEMVGTDPANVKVWC